MGAVSQEKNNQDSVKTRLVKQAKDKFRPHFCQSTFYEQNLNHFHILNLEIEKIISSIKIKTTNLQIKSDLALTSSDDVQSFDKPNYLNHNNKLKLIEISIWVICLSALRRPNDWFASQIPLRTHLENQHSPIVLAANESINVNEIFQLLSLQWPEKLNTTISWTSFLNEVRIKPLPLAAHLSLIAIHLFEYPLIVLDYVPSPNQLLEYQCHFHRVITFEKNIKDWPHITYGQRDPLSFWLHDIIHAQHFFSQPENYRQQIGFYRFIQIILNNNCLNQFKPTSELEFSEAFEYLISDMNTHPLHLLKTLKALIEIHFSNQSALIFDIMAQKSDFSLSQKEAFLTLNTSLFRDEHCDALLNYLSGLVPENSQFSS